MSEVYKLFIEKGGLFGIVCVVISIVLTGVLKIIKKNNYSEYSLNGVFKFLRLFLIISIIFIFVNALVNALVIEQRNDQNKKSQFEPTKRLTQLKNDSIALKGTGYLHIKSNNLIVTQYAYFIGQGWGYDTLVKAPIELISNVKIYTFNNLIILTNRIGESDYKFAYNKIDGLIIYNFFKGLKDGGYDINLEYHYMSAQPITGCIVVILGLLGLFVDTDYSCMLKSFSLAIILIGIALIFS